MPRLLQKAEESRKSCPAPPAPSEPSSRGACCASAPAPQCYWCSLGWCQAATAAVSVTPALEPLFLKGVFIPAVPQSPGVLKHGGRRDAWDDPAMLVGCEGALFAPASCHWPHAGSQPLSPLASVCPHTEQSADLGWGRWEAPAAQTALRSSSKSLIDG